MELRITFFLMLLPALVHAAEWRAIPGVRGDAVAEIEVTVRTPQGEKPGAMQLNGIPGKDGGLYLRLLVKKFDSKLFAPSDWEGPDAPFGKEKLALVSVQSSAGRQLVSLEGGAWWTENDTFLFDVALHKLPPALRTSMIKVLSGNDLHIEWAIQEKGRMRVVLTAVSKITGASSAVSQELASAKAL